MCQTSGEHGKMPKVYGEITPTTLTLAVKRKGHWIATPTAKSPVVLLASLRSTAIRIVDMPKHKVPLFTRLRNPQNHKKTHPWEFVKQGYPIGKSMNETTHIFDGRIFTNSQGVSRFFMAALPCNVADDMTNHAAKTLGGLNHIKTLDTIEHLMFRHYGKQGEDLLWVVFPQEAGFRILFLSNGLPRGAWHISNDVNFRHGELSRFYDGSFEVETILVEAPPRKMVSQHPFYTSAAAEDPLPPPERIERKITLKKAIILNGDEDTQWIQDFLTEQGVEVQVGAYNFRAYL